MKLLSPTNTDNNSNIIIQTLLNLKKSFWHCLTFSFIINVLSLALPIYSMQVLDRVLGSSSIETLIYLSIIILLTVVVANSITNVRDAAFSFISKSFEKKLSSIIFKKNISDSFKVNIGTQYLSDLSIIKSFISSPNLPLIFDIPWIFIFLSAIFYIHWIPGLIISLCSLSLALMAFLNVKILKSDSEKLNELQIKNNRKLEALTRNSEVAIAMGMMENLNNKYQQWQQELHDAEKKLKTKTKTISTIVKNLRYIIQISITFVSAILIIKGKMSSGGMIAISTLSSKVLAPFDASATIFQAITSIKKSYQRLSNVIKSDNSENRIELPTPNGDIDFENVTFLPIGSSSPIINNISFKVLSGEIIGIIGKSGSGKTTLARLLAGIIEPNRGKVKLDSAPLNFWNKNSLGKFIGYLPQDIELFQASIKDNVSRMDSNAKDEEVIKAAKQAGVHELILSFSNGYETEIGLTNISAGQRQRIGLARCFYEQPKVIILDEPNSNLDIEGENFLMNAINIAKSNKTTVFIISHKPSILKVVDKIMVIGDGELKAFEVKEKIMQNFVVDNEKNKKY